MTQKNLFWFRQDLRLSDNPALYEAAQSGEVMAVYIFDEDHRADFKMGSASRWWLHHSLSALNRKLGGKLNIYRGKSQEVILKLIAEYSIQAIYWNRCYDPFRIKADSEIKSFLKKRGIECKSFNGSLLWEPWEVMKEDGTPYKVFTAFYQKASLQGKYPGRPLPAPNPLTLVKETLNTIPLTELGLLPKIKWHASLERQWVIGEEGAQGRLACFLENGLTNYKEGRDFPDRPNVSRLSPCLHFGEISPRQVWHGVDAGSTSFHIPERDKEYFFRELGWREFSYHLLYHFPDFPYQNFQKKFDRFPWQVDETLLKKWQQGQTGYPIVDAGMRELWQTGYMHNRVRMIVGSFLVKNLLLDWRHGERWFWDCLVDADLANNSVSWQWVAGSGVDAAPYFRIFNPVTQGEKFDPDGIYTRRFVPELKNMPNTCLFKPWEAPEYILKAAGVILGQTYPKPVVELGNSRKKALEAFASLPKELQFA